MPEPQPPLDTIRAWVRQHGYEPAELEPLAGDVSARRYLRLRTTADDRFIVAWHPPRLRDAARRFVVSGRLLTAAGVRVPELIAASPNEGLLLLEDVGRRNLYQAAPPSWVERRPWYEVALHDLQRIATIPASQVAELNPRLDADLLGHELESTDEHLWSRLGLHDAASQAVWRDVARSLCTALHELTPVPCHRDFMVRNLMPLSDGRIAVLDHQDLRLGPPHYDLAALLNDTLFPPPRLESELLRSAGVTVATELAYRHTAAQRTLKAAGTYAAFVRRGHRTHLELIPTTLHRALGHLERVPEAATAVERLREAWQPLLDASPTRLSEFARMLEERR